MSNFGLGALPSLYIKDRVYRVTIIIFSSNFVWEGETGVTELESNVKF